MDELDELVEYAIASYNSTQRSEQRHPALSDGLFRAGEAVAGAK